MTPRSASHGGSGLGRLDSSRPIFSWPVDPLRSEMRSYLAPQIEGISQRFDRFVLVNTNSRYLDHFTPAFGEMSAALQD